MSDAQPIPMPQPAIKVGDPVTWMHSSSNGRSIGFSTRTGKLVQINKENGMAQAKTRHGKLQWLPLRRFRNANVRSELTEMVMSDPK